jgi:hypothetical protein
MSSRLIAREQKPSGEAIAAFMSPMLGLLALSIANLLWEADRVYYTEVYLRIGSWIPKYDRIGPFTGKETILLVVWLVSWVVLHLLLRKREMRVAPWAIAFLIGIAVAALLVWPPVAEALIPE